MITRRFATAVLSLLVALFGWAPASSAGLLVVQKDFDDVLVTGLGGSKGTRPHLDVSARTHTSDVNFDGGSNTDPFVLFCQAPVEGTANTLRVTWSDADGDHVFELGQITASACPDDGRNTYFGAANGICDGAPAAAVFNFSENEAGGDQRVGVAIQGGCELGDDEGGLLLEGEFVGCLAFGDDPTACEPAPQPSLSGRMTGGGSFGTDPKVSHGMTLRCSGGPNSLEVNWADSKFRLDDLGDSFCSDQSGDGSFDTYEGRGTGTCNGTPGVEANFEFTDGGAEGDGASISIDAAGDCPGLDASGALTTGNQTAHPSG